MQRFQGGAAWSAWSVHRFKFWFPRINSRLSIIIQSLIKKKVCTCKHCQCNIMHFSDDRIDVVIIIVRLQSVRKSRLFLPSASSALPASWSADWGARAARPISSCPPTPCPHTQSPPPPPCILLLLLPILPPLLSCPGKPLCSWPTTTPHVLTPYTTFLQLSLLSFSSLHPKEL